MSRRIKAAIFTLLLAVSAAAGVSPRHAQAAGLSFDIAGSPLTSAGATLGPSFCLGCSVTTSLNSALDSIAFTLNPGESTTFDFFNVSVAGLGGAFAKVNATLAFDMPYGVSVNGQGNGAFVTMFGIVSAGLLIWEDLPVIVDGTDGSRFSVDFSDIAGFTLGNSADVTATVTALRSPRAAPPAAVPAAVVSEPGTIALLGLGLLGFACRRLHRRHA